MTIIEFFDKSSIENIAGCLLCKPEKMILVGNNPKLLSKANYHYSTFLKNKNVETEISTISTSKNHLGSIIDTLAEIVETHNDCVFDLTGGDDLYLVAVGNIMNRYGNRVQCHRFNFRTDSLIDCDADGNTCAVDSFDISIEDNIRIYGGELVSDPGNELYTHPWDFNDEFLEDIALMWNVCKKNPRMWNNHIATLGALFDFFGEEDQLSLTFDVQKASLLLPENGIKYFFVDWMMQELHKVGLITNLSVTDYEISFSIKNEQIKRTLTIAGQILELLIASRLLQLQEADGSQTYHEVMVGAVIDWDPMDDDSSRTLNEIDVIAMKGSLPIFISCKNGMFDANELYKLNTVATRFGNKYAKKILVSTELARLGARSESVRTRMENMGIRSIDNIAKMSAHDLDKILKSLWI